MKAVTSVAESSYLAENGADAAVSVILNGLSGPITVNGIDYNVWNPEVDNLIPVHYGLDNIDAKYDNKRALRHRLMLAPGAGTAMSCLSAMTGQGCHGPAEEGAL